MKPVEIAPGIFNVGVKDWSIRDFHGYSTPLGTTYNAFLILDEKIALIDSVKKGFGDGMLECIGRIVDPDKIDLVVSNHTEMDHSGCLADVMRRIGAEKPVYCSKMGVKNLSLHFGSGLNLQPVEDGGRLPLGRRTLRFMETRMVHWPDSMFTYLEPDAILFSSDGFGQHYAGFETFDDQVGEAVMAHAKKYFANILMLYSSKILKILDQVRDSGLAIRMICPDHGVLWRQDPGRIVEAYRRWSRQETEAKAVVVFDTMWGSTERMAEAVAAGISQQGVQVRPMHLRRWHRSDIMTEVQDARAVVVGSPTLNNGLFPTVSDFLTYMKGLKPVNRFGGAFGSYGWSGEAVKLIAGELEAMRFKLLDAGLRIQFVPDRRALETSFDFGVRMGKAVVGQP